MSAVCVSVQLVAQGQFRVLKVPLGFIKVLEWVSSSDQYLHHKDIPLCLFPQLNCRPDVCTHPFNWKTSVVWPQHSNEELLKMSARRRSRHTPVIPCMKWKHFRTWKDPNIDQCLCRRHSAVSLLIIWTLNFVGHSVPSGWHHIAWSSDGFRKGWKVMSYIYSGYRNWVAVLYTCTFLNILLN